MKIHFTVQRVRVNGVEMGGRSVVAFFAPVALGRGQNEREHHYERAARVKAERDTVRLCWPKLPVPLPCSVRFVRVDPPRPALDDDNLVASLKAVRDEVAALLGLDDADPRVKWERPSQECKEGQDSGVWVVISGTLRGPTLAPKERKPRARRPSKAALLPRAQATAGFKATPAFIPAPKEKP